MFVCVWGRRLQNLQDMLQSPCDDSVQQDPAKDEIFIQAGISLVRADRINIYW